MSPWKNVKKNPKSRSFHDTWHLLRQQINSIDDQTGIIKLRLRSEREGKGDGRIYTIKITATDASGNFSEAIVKISAPHDRRKK